MRTPTSPMFNDRWETLELTPSVSVPTFDPDDPDYIVEPGQSFKGLNFDAVVNINVDLGSGSRGYGSGVLLADGKHVLTAAHVAEIGGTWNTSVNFDMPAGRQSVGVENIYIHPDWVSSPGSYPWSELPGSDMAIIELASAAPTTGIEFYRGNGEIGNNFVVSGYGIEGTGFSGADENDFQGGYVKRWGMNTFDTDDLGLSHIIDFQNIAPGSALFYDFDYGTSEQDTIGQWLGQPELGTGSYEVMTTSGDSGGPGFVQTTDGAWQVAGLVQAGQDAVFGDIAAMARVSNYQTWIDSVTGGASDDEPGGDLPDSNEPSGEIFTGYNAATASAQDLVTHLAGDVSGISMLSGSANYIGAERAVSTYESFDLGGGIGMENPGILLTTGDGVVPLQNTSSNYTRVNNTLGDSQLDSLAKQAFGGAGETQDAAILEFSFTAQDPSVKAVSFELMFGSDEFPEFVDSNFVDIAALTVNGKNYALFDGDPEKPLSVIGNNVDSGSLRDNGNGPISGSSPYSIEYNGISPSMIVNIPLDNSSVYNVRLAIADTGDAAYDSGLFVSNFATSKVGAEGLQVKVVADESGGTLASAGPNTATYFEGGTGNDIMLGSTAADVYDLGAGGSNTLQGSAGQLHNDSVLGFTQNDKINVQDSFFTLDDVTVTQGSAILDIDTDGDGVADTNVRLEGDYDIDAFSVEQTAEGSVITYNGQDDTFEVDVPAFVGAVFDELGVTISPALTPAVNVLIDRAFDDAGNIAGATFLKVPQVRDNMAETFSDGNELGGVALINAIQELNEITSNVLVGMQTSDNAVAQELWA